MQAVQSPVIPIVGDLIRSNPGTIPLGQGIVFYPPPPQAIEGISEFLANPNNHRYQSIEGIPPLLETIARKLKTDNGIEIADANRIVVTVGSNMGFVNALLAIADAGDEVILQTPFYFNHEMAIQMANCAVVTVPTDANYQIDLARLEAAITPKTKAIVTISPNNPTGVVYPEATLRQVNALCRDRGIYHITDEAYEYFTYDDAVHFSPGSIPDSESYTISLFSLSKSYGFASWRIGYMVIPAHLFTAVKKIQDTIAICAPVISQYAAWGAMQTGADYCRQQRQAIAQVRQLCLKELSTVSDLCTVPLAKGAFYFLLKLHTDLDSMTAVERLIRGYQVAGLPGIAFGLTDGCYLRIGYGALQPETTIEGMQRLVRGVRELVG